MSARAYFGDLSGQYSWCYMYVSAVCRAVFKGGGVTGSTPIEIMTKKLLCPSIRLFHISVQWSLNVISLCKLFAVNWLKVQSKWLLSDAWFYALNLPKIVCRPGSAWTRWGAYIAPTDPMAGSWGREGKGEMEGQEGEKGWGRKGKGGGEGKEAGVREGEREGYPPEWKSVGPGSICHTGILYRVSWTRDGGRQLRLHAVRSAGRRRVSPARRRRHLLDLPPAAAAAPLSARTCRPAGPTSATSSPRRLELFRSSRFFLVGDRGATSCLFSAVISVIGDCSSSSLEQFAIWREDSRRC